MGRRGDADRALEICLVLENDGVFYQREEARKGGVQ